MMMKKDLALAAETEGYMDDIAAFFIYYVYIIPKLKIFYVFVLWPFILCMVWYEQVYATFFHERLAVVGLRYIVVVWRLQGGYLAIDTDITRAQYVFTSVYPHNRSDIDVNCPR